MNKRSVILVSGIILALAGLACGQSTPQTTRPAAMVLQAQADVVAAQETADAQETRTAQDAVARATSDALNAQAQATVQVMDAQATAAALTAEATRQAWSFQATATAQAVEATRQAKAIQATTTAEARNATATARADLATATQEAATSTAQAIQDNARATAVQATAQHVARQDAVERITQPARAVGWVLFVLAGLALLLWSLFQLLPIVKARLGTIRRDERGDPPLLALAGAGGIVVIDPSRLWSGATTVNDGVSQPLLTHPQYQDGTTKRAQWVDWMKGRRPRPIIAQPAGRALHPGGNGLGDGWEVQEPHAPQWPTRVPLSGILDGPPSVRDLVLGVTVREDGRSEIVRADMGRLVHVAVGGSSGWGKSVFLRALAFQLAQSLEPVDLALIDLEGATFAPFAQCGRLLWPVADTERDALAILQKLTREMDRRKALYADFPGVDSLRTYNARAGDPLAPVVCLVDEATALLAGKGVEGAIRTLVLRARKYGLWCVLGGQDWKATSLDTAIRNQLASRVQFKAMSASQSRVLLQRNGAELLDVPGRALAILPGRNVIELQAPIISHQDIVTATSNSGPRWAMPEAQDDGGDPGQVARIKALAAQGLSKRQIALEVFGYAGGAAYTAVNQALNGDTTTTQTAVHAHSIR